MKRSFDQIWNLVGCDVPAGMVYEWKVVEVQGVPVHTQQLNDYEDGGWQPVPSERHPLFPVKYRGCVLMELPAAAHEEAQKAALAFARATASCDAARCESILNLYVPPGFRSVVNPADLPYTAVGYDWVKTDQLGEDWEP